MTESTSDLLSRIDPDGTLRDAMCDAWRADSGPHAADPFARVLIALAALRDPDEPTLAGIREKVEALPTFISNNGVAEQFGSGYYVGRSSVLALLEPRQREPAKNYVDGSGYEHVPECHGKLFRCVCTHNRPPYDEPKQDDPRSPVFFAETINRCDHCDEPIKPSTGHGMVHENGQYWCDPGKVKR